MIVVYEIERSNGVRAEVTEQYFNAVKKSYLEGKITTDIAVRFIITISNEKRKK